MKSLLLQSGVLISLTLTGCDDACPGPAVMATSGTATWCETAQGVRSGAYSVVDRSILRIQGTYVAGEEDGEWAWFWPDGSLHERGRLRRGERVGDWERHAQDGTLLPLTRYGRATTETEGVILTNAHPDPSVFSTTWLGAPVWQPSKIGDLILAPQATGIVALDPDSGTVIWQIDSPSRLADRPLGNGLRTAVAFTERGGVLVARLGDDLPGFQVYEIDAAESPAPVANDFGVVYVDRAGQLHDHAFEDALRPVPDLVPTALALAGDRLIIGTADGTVAQWDRVQGIRTWSISLDAPITRIHSPDWETVLVESNDTWFGLGFTTGVQRWEQAVENPDDDPTQLDNIRIDEAGVDIIRANGSTLSARLDHPSPPLVLSDGAWVGTRAGLLVHLLDLPLGSPEHAPWPGRVLTSLTVGGQITRPAPWESWQVPSVGAVRTALPLGDQRGAETTVQTQWFDLPEDTGSRQRTWATGWEHTRQRAWQISIGDVYIWTQQTPPPVAPADGEWIIDGWVAYADRWTRDRTIVVNGGHISTPNTAEDWGQAQRDVEATEWRAATQTTATWTGVPIAPWIVAWTAAPEGWGGWQHPAGFVTAPQPEPTVIETPLP
jgi:hypothetical protein